MAHPLPRYLTQVVLPYAMFAALWIFLSDQLLLALVDDEEWRTVLQTYKGLAFVTITSLLLYELLRRVHSRKDLIRFEQERLRNRIFDILESMTDGFVALDRDWRYQYLNARAAEMLGRDPSELIDKVIWIEFPEGRDQDFYHAYQRVMKTQQAETIEAYYPPWQRWYENRIYPSPEGLHIFFQDVTARKQAEAWREGQSQVLAQIIAEQPLSTILETLIYVIESQALGSLGTVMLMDDDDQHLHYGAGPSLPPGLAPAIDGMAIGASAGACGTAAFTRQLVIIEDFQTDPRGVAYRALAQQLNLHACWSQPIFSAAGNVLGTFAMYYTEPRTPLLAERQLIAEAGHMAAVAIEAAHNRSALLASETRFRSTFEQAAVGIAHVAPDGRFLRINQRFCDIAGYPFQELLNLSFQDITHAEDLDADVGQVQRVLADEIQIYSMEKRYLRKNASIVWVMLTVSLVRKADATPDYFIAVIEDISEQKRVASLLHSSEARLRLALDAAQMGTFDWDIANNHTTWSYWHEVLWGFQPGEFDGSFDSFAARVHSDDLPSLNTELARCISAHEPYIGDFRVVWPDASAHWISARGEFFYDALGQAIRMRGVVREVTARIDAQRALQKSEEQLRLAIDAAQMGTYDWDIPNNNIAWSHWHEMLWGYVPGEFDGSYAAVACRVHPDDLSSVEAEINQCMAQHQAYQGELRVVWPDDSIHWIAGRGEFTYSAAGQPLHMRGTVREITARKQAAMRIAEDAKSLERLSRKLLAAQETERRHIARELHDEVGQLLTVVKLDLQTVLRQSQSDDLAQTLHEGMDSIDRVIARVRDLSLDLRPSMLDDFGLVPALRWLVQRHAKNLGAGRNSIDLDLPADSLRFAGTVETACFRIVQEALTNTLRHAEAAHIKISLTQLNEKISVKISDDGQGFDLAATQAAEQEGSGFGLLGMKERTELAGGVFEITTIPGQGTTVLARFPAPLKHPS